MKKEKIYSIVIALVSLLLFFMPITKTDDYWMSILQEVIVSFRQHSFNLSLYLFELIVVIIGILAIAMSIVNIIMNKRIFQFVSSATSFINTILWFVLLFARFKRYGESYFRETYKWFIHGADTNIIWLILYFVMLLGILVLNALQYVQYLPPRRPTKAERMQAQIDELQKQVDELKKGE